MLLGHGLSFPTFSPTLEPVRGNNKTKMISTLNLSVSGKNTIALDACSHSPGEFHHRDMHQGAGEFL